MHEVIQDINPYITTVFYAEFWLWSQLLFYAVYLKVTEANH